MTFTNGLSSIERPPNTACTRLGVRAAFLGIFLACAESRFEGESTLPPQAGNASRWATYHTVLPLTPQKGEKNDISTTKEQAEDKRDFQHRCWLILLCSCLQSTDWATGGQLDVAHCGYRVCGWWNMGIKKSMKF